MTDSLSLLMNHPLSRDGRITQMFRTAGIHDFAGAARHVWRLPYGRIENRAESWRVLTEGRGTCTTKHALLAELAREQRIEMHLMLGIFEMEERNTPGVGSVLERYGLTRIPEAHCYLRYKGARIDVTGVPAGAEPIEKFLYEEPITLEQIGAYKIALHRRFLQEWTVTGAGQGRSLEDAWRIREECIAALSAGAHIGRLDQSGANA
jgi:hypothetical protein